MAVTSAVTSPTTTSSNTASATTSAIGEKAISQNFDTFLTLLTTQLKNQNPLDPLDTNQFTQQLVQFAQVEQQMSMNSQLTTLVSLQKTAQTTAAVSFLGSTVVVDGETAALSAGKAGWTYSTDKPATAVFNIKNSTGAVVYSESRTLNAGGGTFNWNGRATNGQQMPDGDYTLSITAKDASGNVTSVPTEVEGTVDGVDLSQNPPVLKIGSKSFSLDKVKQVRRLAN
jgi:flagellar basal-body rod modification protein FlgD